MKEKIKLIILTILVTLGVLFVVLMLLPDDEEDISVAEAENKAEVTETQETAETQEVTETQEVEETENKTDGKIDMNVRDIFEEADEGDPEEDVKEEKKETGNTVKVNIPSSALSDYTIDFRTVSLDNREVTQDVFSDYDITIVHIWGTFCGPCIVEMPEYGRFLKEKPDNVNLVGIISDVYDGIDINVTEAHDILESSDADFLNLRNSDSLYDIVEQFQYVPSSFLVDSKGHLIGEAMDGGDFYTTMEELEKYIK